MSEALKAVHILENVILEIESDNQILKTRNEILSNEKNALEQEISHILNDFNSDEVIMEKIHWLYYDICDRVDQGKSIDLDFLNKFFKQAINKQV